MLRPDLFQAKVGRTRRIGVGQPKVGEQDRRGDRGDHSLEKGSSGQAAVSPERPARAGIARFMVTGRGCCGSHFLWRGRL